MFETRFCPKCGHKVILRDRYFAETEIIICEDCEREISIRDNGAVTQRQLARARHDLMSQYASNHKPFENYKKTLSRVVAKQIELSVDSIKFYHPERDRNVEAPGDIRART